MWRRSWAAGAGTEFRLLPRVHASRPPPLLQDESTGEITFYMKGADVVMAGIVQYNDWLEEEVSGMHGADVGPRKRVLEPVPRVNGEAGACVRLLKPCNRSPPNSAA